MSWKDFDLHPRVVSGPPTYGWRSENPVHAAPVHVGNDLVGYLITSIDPSENLLDLYVARWNASAARWNDDYINNHYRFWRDLMAKSAADGIPAHDAFHALLGREGPTGTGRVSTQTQQFENTDAVLKALDPWRAAKEATRERRRP